MSLRCLENVKMKQDGNFKFFIKKKRKHRLRLWSPSPLWKPDLWKYVVNLITYYALPSLRQISVIPVVDIINGSRAICSARRSNEERLVAPRRVNLPFFSLYFPRYRHLSFRLRQFRIQRGRAASIIRVSSRTRGTNDTHANAREISYREVRCASTYVYQIKKEKVNSLPVEDGMMFVRKLVYARLIAPLYLSN